MDGKSENRVGIRGRKPGVPNRTTRESRKAIALFVDQNLPRLDMWLNQVANGLPKVDLEGNPIRDNAGSVVFVVRPDPAGAMKALSDIMEYHLPKLSRTDVQVSGVVAAINNLSPAASALLEMTGSDLIGHLQAMRPEQLPSWLEQGIIDVTPTRGDEP